MSGYLGDFSTNATVHAKFTSVNASAGKPVVLTSGVAKVYKTNTTAMSTAGVTLTANLAATTGLNHVKVNTSANTFYAGGLDYQIVLTQGTVNAVTVRGYVVGEFSLKNRPANVKWIKGSSANADNLVTRVDAAISSRLPTTAASVNVTKIKGTTANADNLVSRVDVAVSSRMSSTAVPSVSVTKVKGSTVSADKLQSLANSYTTAEASALGGTWINKLDLVYGRLFRKVTQNSTVQKVYKSNGTTVIGTMTVSETTALQTKGAAS